MTRKDELLALADRVEALTGPDREVDYLIMRQVMNIGGDPRGAEAYTASLDAAMTLVPEGWDHLEIYRPDHNTLGWTVHILPAQGRPIDGQGFAPTYAIALTAACLRAIASQEPNT